MKYDESAEQHLQMAPIAPEKIRRARLVVAANAIGAGVTRALRTLRRWWSEWRQPAAPGRHRLGEHVGWEGAPGELRAAMVAVTAARLARAERAAL